MMLRMARKPDTRTDTRYGDGMATLSFKAHKDVRDALKQRADKDGVAVSDVIREALVNYLDLPQDTTRVAGRIKD